MIPTTFKETISPFDFLTFRSFIKKYQKRDFATTVLGANILILYNFGAGFASVGRWRPMTWYSVRRPGDKSQLQCRNRRKEHPSSGPASEDCIPFEQAHSIDLRFTRLDPLGGSNSFCCLNRLFFADSKKRRWMNAQLSVRYREGCGYPSPIDIINMRS